MRNSDPPRDDIILEGIKVLDVGTFIFGPATATVMSDFGAEVIKVEPPGTGDPYRYLAQMPPLPACEKNYCWMLDSRNKKSIALDLKNPQSREIVSRLVAWADVLVTNFPTSVLERLRLTHADLRSINETLIFAHATGYGDLGDESEKPGYDATAWWARSGLMDSIRSTGSEPALPMAGMGDHSSALALLGAIMMALYRRERTGKGAKVTSSLMANGVWSNSVMVQAMLCGASHFEHLSRKASTNALVNIYESADERWFFLLMIQEDKDWERFARCIGHPELLADPRFNDKPARRENAADLVDLLDEVFASKTYDRWREILDAASVTFGPVAQLADLADDRQLRVSGVLREIEGSSARTVDSPMSIDGYRKVAPRPAPGIGEHSDEILASLGYDTAAIEDLRARKVIA